MGAYSDQLGNSNSSLSITEKFAKARERTAELEGDIERLSSIVNDYIRTLKSFTARVGAIEKKLSKK